MQNMPREVCIYSETINKKIRINDLDEAGLAKRLNENSLEHLVFEPPRDSTHFVYTDSFIGID